MHEEPEDTEKWLGESIRQLRTVRFPDKDRREDTICYDRLLEEADPKG